MSKRIERKFTKPTQISKHLYCSICCEVFREPWRLFCGHTFCKHCIDQWMKNSNACPQCRGKIKSALMSKDLIPNRIIEDLEVACPKQYCEWRDRLELLEKHLTICKIDKELPSWLKEGKHFIDVDENSVNELDEQLIERINDEVPVGGLAVRLFKKTDSNTRVALQNVCEKNQTPNKASKSSKRSHSLEFYKEIVNFAEDDDIDEIIEKENNFPELRTKDIRRSLRKNSKNEKINPNVSIVDLSIDDHSKKIIVIEEDSTTRTMRESNIEFIEIPEDEVLIRNYEPKIEEKKELIYEGSTTSMSMKKVPTDTITLIKENSSSGNIIDLNNNHKSSNPNRKTFPLSTDKLKQSSMGSAISSGSSGISSNCSNNNSVGGNSGSNSNFNEDKICILLNTDVKSSHISKKTNEAVINQHASSNISLKRKESIGKQIKNPKVLKKVKTTLP